MLDVECVRLFLIVLGDALEHVTKPAIPTSYPPRTALNASIGGKLKLLSESLRCITWDHRREYDIRPSPIDPVPILGVL